MLKTVNDDAYLVLAGYWGSNMKFKGVFKTYEEAVQQASSAVENGIAGRDEYYIAKVSEITQRYEKD